MKVRVKPKAGLPCSSSGVNETMCSGNNMIGVNKERRTSQGNRV
ncbi:MAG: hypothetical protein V3V31_15110 [Methylococcales bacterium]